MPVSAANRTLQRGQHFRRMALGLHVFEHPRHLPVLEDEGGAEYALVAARLYAPNPELVRHRMARIGEQGKFKAYLSRKA